MLRVRTLVGLLLLFPVALPAAGAPAFPALTGRVVDGAGMLPAAPRAELTTLLAAHEAATGQQIVVVTVASLAGQSIEDYGYQLGRHWGIGRAGVDDGVLLIVAAAERQIRIEVGYGLEGTLTDAAAWDIIQTHILPHFRRGDFAAGIVAGARAIVGLLDGTLEFAPEPAAPSLEERIGGLVFWLLVVFILVNSFSGRHRSARLGHAVLAGTALGGLRGSSGSRSGGGGGGGGFGGRGGSFGGGGASGGW
ncbi:MAG: TPM domain-containing protein [Pseudomonadales bacterium]|nr:TPM domain-containing protein [Pseudomonadales bacterium]